jgi:hypothetical protein
LETDLSGEWKIKTAFLANGGDIEKLPGIDGELKRLHAHALQELPVGNIIREVHILADKR